MEEEKSESRKGKENDVTGQGLFPLQMQTAAAANLTGCATAYSYIHGCTYSTSDYTKQCSATVQP